MAFFRWGGPSVVLGVTPEKAPEKSIEPAVTPVVAAGFFVFCDSSPADAGACGAAFRAAFHRRFVGGSRQPLGVVYHPGGGASHDVLEVVLAAHQGVLGRHQARQVITGIEPQQLRDADGGVGIREGVVQAGSRSSRAKTQFTTARKQMAGR